MRPSAPPKTTASPGRPDKLAPTPAPALTGLLKGKSGSRSTRGNRASMVRSSPMFVSRRRTSSEADEGEPSSPKVTCMGQVRMRRKKTNGEAAKPSSRKWRRPRCRCFDGTFLCFRWRPVWRRVKELPLRLSYSRARSSSSIKEEPPEDAKPEHTVTSASEDDEDDEEETKVFVPSATPPRNALLLMRCRSAPHNRAAPAPVAPAQPDMAAGEDESKGDGEKKKKMMMMMMMCSLSPSSPSSHPLVLMRCKSEPASTAAAKLAAVATSETLCDTTTKITHQ
ncbi:uncharacterized protein LOC120265585 [Dioscorea cayenensis subsp. rotundata]|uniref:Uncharacterized protein LOC120265585 n=1 Tax=Dioscorea cayennensis subsp. rotundata TaxID=55577 RepID=A0AB40BPS7_DIOCR|nr:uncharacterized protein LOC120265585 [Dioscorea cayenensis subsp. rotundata]